MPKKAPEALKSKASGCGSKTEQGWNKVEQKLEQPAVPADNSACGRNKGSLHYGRDDILSAVLAVFVHHRVVELLRRFPLLL